MADALQCMMKCLYLYHVTEIHLRLHRLTEDKFQGLTIYLIPNMKTSTVQSSLRMTDSVQYIVDHHLHLFVQSFVTEDAKFFLQNRASCNVRESWKQGQPCLISGTGNCWIGNKVHWFECFVNSFATFFPCLIHCILEYEYEYECWPANLVSL